MQRAQANLGLALFPADTLAKELLLVTAGAAITALCAQIAIPWQPVPVTLQTFAVLLCGIALGPRLGTFSQLLYLGLGLAGAPVFASATGATYGYLFSFPLAAMLLGWFCAKGFDRSVWTLLPVMALAQGLILLCGTVWLSFYVGGIEHAWLLGAKPFLVIEALKSLILILAVPAVWKAVRIKS